MPLVAVIAMQVQSFAGGRIAPPPTDTTVRAARAAAPPVIDGRDDDAVWRSAPVITRFLESQPSEGAMPRVRTEARLAYDSHNLYVFVRAFDPHPDSIVHPLSRRDDTQPSDQITVMLDSYRDRRTGYAFAVNPAGVKSDYAIYNDGNTDAAWDAVWDVATRIDALGWTAELRIPLSQLRYESRQDATFGILIERFVQRYTETVSWPLYRLSRSGLVSQFGELTGLAGLERPGAAEITPYLVAKTVQAPPAAFETGQRVTIGGDLKYQLTSNLLLDATVNPDFGQVEADPSVLNLGAFETFFAEQRPFFVEGKGLFTFPVNCVVVLDCNTGEGMFYSRRIGREPELGDIYGDSTITATRIAAAAKLIGRFRGGLTIGGLDAMTDRVGGLDGVTLEPSANYAVLRANQDYAGGDGNVGFIVTAVNRTLDSFSSAYLHRSAYTGGIDGRRRFARDYEVSGSLDYSRVTGSPAAIALTQQDAVHLYQRPDGPLTFDSTRTSLSGSSAEVRVAKVGGQRLHFETAYQRRSPGFEINDIGFLRQADQQEWTTWAALFFRTPNRVFRQLQWNFNNWEYWSAAGLPTERAVNTNAHTQLTNRWWLHLGGTIGQLGATYCDRCARGGPAVRQDSYVAPWFGIQGDDRRPLIPYLWVNYFRGDQGRSRSLSLSPEVDLKLSSRFTTSFSATYTRNTTDAQYVATDTGAASTVRYTFAHLEQKTLALTFRVDYTFTPSASLQVYASPFVSKGTYSDVRDLADARAVAYDARYRPSADTAVVDDPGGFNVQQFRSNIVFRWEYRPGSTLFLVWSQGRQDSWPIEGERSLGGNFGELFGQRPDDTFLVKFSYRLAR